MKRITWKGVYLVNKYSLQHYKVWDVVAGSVLGVQVNKNEYFVFEPKVINGELNYDIQNLVKNDRCYKQPKSHKNYKALAWMIAVHLLKNGYLWDYDKQVEASKEYPYVEDEFYEREV